MYSFNSRIRYSEVNSKKQLDLGSIIDYFQDCSTFQSEDLNIGIDFLDQQERAWIMNAWQIVIDRLPCLCETVTISTWPYDFKTMYGYRNFIMKDASDTLCIRANSIWVYMDTKSHRPVKVTPEIAARYPYEEKLDMEYAPRKIKLPEHFIEEKEFPVLSSHIDTYNHVNNGQYIKMAENYLKESFQIRQLRAEYRNSAVLGDIIYPRYSLSDGLCTVALCDKNQMPYAIVEFQELK